MITTNTKVDKKIKKLNPQTTYIVADFDQTITTNKTTGTWALFSESKILPKEYIEERDILFNYYHPMEVSVSIKPKLQMQMMEEWWNKHLNLLIKYKLKEKDLKNTIQNTKALKLRPGAKEFLKYTNENKIPVIIISAGIRNIIVELLDKEEANFDNIIIISNQIDFKNQVASGISHNIIHAHNKGEVAFFKETKEKIKGRKNIILLGNTVGDVKMLEPKKRKKAIKIGYLTKPDLEKEYNKVYDIILSDDTSFEEIKNILKL